MKYHLHELPDGSLIFKPEPEMQGPEQGLVGESRSDSETKPAEEAKPGERGVAEIGGAVELLNLIDREIKKVRRRRNFVRNRINPFKGDEFDYMEAALGRIREAVCVKSDQRSDLCNADVEAPPRRTPNQEQG